MANLIKLRQLAVMQRCLWNHVHKVTRNISTSKNNETNSDAISEPKKNWVSYGFDYESQKEDTNAHNASFFFSVTLCLVFGTFAWAYAPDVHMRDWAQREAFLELRIRERNNQPRVSPDYIPPDLMNLPNEDELCEIEIII